MVEVVIAAVAGVLGTALASWATIRAARTTGRSAVETAQIAKEIRPAEIEFVDVSAVDPADLDDEERAALAPTSNRQATVVILDIKLRNTGGETAFLHTLHLRPWDVRDVAQPSLPEPVRPRPARDAIEMSPTHYYRGRRNDEYGERRISQVLAPGAADRFLVSVESPVCFFRADISVSFNGGCKAEMKGRKFLRKPPVWVDSDSMMELLRNRLEECGPFAMWEHQRVSAAEAGRRCLASYGERLAAAAEIYALIGRTSDPEYAAIHASRARIPHMCQEMGLD
ncbi:hypothetical protein STANM337S_06536 [Streptomyces tanashiensis]